MKSITWDVGIVAALALLLAYSLLIRRHKSLATLVSVYVAYFVASSWGERIAQLFSGDRVLFNQVWIKANATPIAVQAFLLILFTFLISSFLKLGGKRSRYSTVEVVAYAICTLAVGLMFILILMPADVRENAMSSSQVLPYVYKWKEWILVAPVFVMIYFGIYGDDDL
jgi:hypothetical protein